MKTSQFRKKPVVIEAFQLPALDEDVSAFAEWAARVEFDGYTSERDGCMAIETLEGTMTAEPGDWIVKGVKGEFYPCKPDVFAATYENAAHAPANAVQALVTCSETLHQAIEQGNPLAAGVAVGLALFARERGFPGPDAAQPDERAALIAENEAAMRWQGDDGRTAKEIRAFRDGYKIGCLDAALESASRSATLSASDAADLCDATANGYLSDVNAQRSTERYEGAQACARVIRERLNISNKH